MPQSKRIGLAGLSAKGYASLGGIDAELLTDFLDHGLLGLILAICRRQVSIRLARSLTAPSHPQKQPLACILWETLHAMTVRKR